MKSGAKRLETRTTADVVTQKPRFLSAHNELFIVLVFVALAAWIYAPSAHYDFIGYDDPPYVTDNPHVLAGLSWQNVLWAFTTGEAANWHPLTWLSHMLDVQLFGINPGAHHIMSVLLHLVNACLLFGLLFSMTGARGRSAFASALFLVHPLQVESVAWIAERKNVLSTTLGLLALWAYARYVHHPGRGRYVTVVLLFALGLMAKPMLVTLPLVMLLLDWWPLRRIHSPLFQSNNKPVFLKLLWEKIPLIGLTVISSLVTIFVQHEGGAVRGVEYVPVTVRLLNAVVSYVAYLGKAAWPDHLAIFYPLSEIPVWKAAAGGFALGLVTAMVVRAASRRPYVAVGWFWFLGTLVPVIGLIQVGDQSMADRYGYVPLIGIFLIASWGISEIASEWHVARWVVSGAAALTVLIYTIVSTQQVGYWSNNYVLWKHALAVTENNYFAQVHVGNAVLAEGKTDEAIAHFSEALRVRPTFDMALDDMGIVLLNQGKADEAFPYLVKAVHVNPSFAHAQNDLGVAQERHGQTDEAIACYSEAIRLDPSLEVAHVNLAKLLVTHARVDEGIREYLRASELSANDPTPHYDLAIVFNGRGDTARAIQELQVALRIKPGYTEAQRALSILTNSRYRQ
jgi:cytochrome c-type biogenesis protein CcmH/NrfG